MTYRVTVRRGPGIDLCSWVVSNLLGYLVDCVLNGRLKPCGEHTPSKEQIHMFGLKKRTRKARGFAMATT
jgi:hypothetical protein